MQSNFESEKNQKAFLYTAVICVTLLLIFWLITWPTIKIIPPVVQDLIEVNLGNDNEGFGKEQPLIKGEGAPIKEQIQQDQQTASANEEPAKDIQTDDKANEDAAPVTKIEKNNSTKNEAPKESVKKPVKTNNPVPVTTPAPPKPPKPKVLFPGTSKKDGNNTEQDNGFKNQGDNKNNPGDKGSRNGNANSDGNNPGGRTGTGLKVKGDRRIVNHYIFVGDLPKATINAVIKVSAEGRGTFIRIDPRGSTETDSRYANDIRNKLPNIQFDKSDHESRVTITFNFKVQ